MSAISFPEAAILLVSTKKSRPLGGDWKVSQHYLQRLLYACPETVIELEHMRTIKLEPGGSGFLFGPERQAFGHR